ncbi:hypothetical protein [Modestobacter sp. URMC 112]
MLLPVALTAAIPPTSAAFAAFAATTVTPGDMPSADQLATHGPVRRLHLLDPGRQHLSCRRHCHR